MKQLLFTHIFLFYFIFPASSLAPKHADLETLDPEIASREEKLGSRLTLLGLSPRYILLLSLMDGIFPACGRTGLEGESDDAGKNNHPYGGQDNSGGTRVYSSGGERPAYGGNNSGSGGKGFGGAAVIGGNHSGGVRPLGGYRSSEGGSFSEGGKTEGSAGIKENSDGGRSVGGDSVTNGGKPQGGMNLNPGGSAGESGNAGSWAGTGNDTAEYDCILIAPRLQDPPGAGAETGSLHDLYQCPLQDGEQFLAGRISEERYHALIRKTDGKLVMRHYQYSSPDSAVTMDAEWLVADYDPSVTLGVTDFEISGYFYMNSTFEYYLITVNVTDDTQETGRLFLADHNGAIKVYDTGHGAKIENVRTDDMDSNNLVITRPGPLGVGRLTLTDYTSPSLSLIDGKLSESGMWYLNTIENAHIDIPETIPLTSYNEYQWQKWQSDERTVLDFRYEDASSRIVVTPSSIIVKNDKGTFSGLEALKHLQYLKVLYESIPSESAPSKEAILSDLDAAILKLTVQPDYEQIMPDSSGRVSVRAYTFGTETVIIYTVLSASAPVEKIITYESGKTLRVYTSDTGYSPPAQPRQIFGADALDTVEFVKSILDNSSGLNEEGIEILNQLNIILSEFPRGEVLQLTAGSAVRPQNDICFMLIGDVPGETDLDILSFGGDKMTTERMQNFPEGHVIKQIGGNRSSGSFIPGDSDDIAIPLLFTDASGSDHLYYGNFSTATRELSLYPLMEGVQGISSVFKAPYDKGDPTLFFHAVLYTDSSGANVVTWEDFDPETGFINSVSTRLNDRDVSKSGIADARKNNFLSNMTSDAQTTGFYIWLASPSMRIAQRLRGIDIILMPDSGLPETSA
ncbi:MAG: hypothetical protein JW774_02015 [Candidatus Aureabacteria bacterium]|nr:hypothetical protein [Candidatus Auribacterota bacterium]